jgi:hypothetical protein
MSSRIILINVLGENNVAADTSTDIESMSHIQMLAPANAASFWPLTGWGWTDFCSLLGDYNLTKKPVELFHFRPLLIFVGQYLSRNNLERWHCMLFYCFVIPSGYI